MKSLLILGLGALGALGGCAWFGDDDDDRDVGRETETQRDANMAVDPVSGQRVQTDTMWTATYEDRTYYFTSRENMERFERNPQNYVKRSTEGVR